MVNPQRPDRDEAMEDTHVAVPVPVLPAPARKGIRPGAIAAIALLVLVLAAGVLYAVGYVKASDQLPQNARISGVPVGGLDRDAAIRQLQAQLSARAEQPIDVTINGERDQVEPTAAGLSIDFSRSVDQAGGGKSFDPRHIWRVLTGGSSTEAVIAVDQSQLRPAVSELAQEHNRKPKDASVAFKGAKIVKSAAVTGITLREEAAAKSIRAAYFSSSAPVDLAVDLSEPGVTTEEVNSIVEKFAQPAVSGPIKVSAGQAGTFEVTPAMIGRSITFEPKDGSLTPVLDAKRLRRVAEPEVDKVELNKPKNATVRLVDGRPKVIPAVNGTVVSATNLAAAVEPVLTKSGGDRSASVKLTGAQATFSTEDGKKLGIKEVTGKFTTHFPHASYRNVNIGRAAELINGTLLKPGDTFSLNDIVGERTKANGFVEGNIITRGKFRLELGGGVSQSATTTFNAMFFAGLKDVEHKPHTLFIDRYPPGREATVAWPSVDLKFKNDTKYGVLVEARRVKSKPGKRGSITVKMWSTKTYDKVESSPPRKSNFTTGREVSDPSPKCQPMSPVQGFDVEYSRLFYAGGKVVKKEDFSWRYSPTDRVRCTNVP